MSAGARPFAGLRPERVLDAVERFGLRPTGALLALDSFENRVFRVGLDGGEAVVVKFYRPGRWTDQAILEEHAFLAELEAAELPVVPVLRHSGRSLHDHRGLRYALFPVAGGRSFEGGAEALFRLGALIGRLHAVGGRRPFIARPRLDPVAAILSARAKALASRLVPATLEKAYEAACLALAAQVAHTAKRLPPQPILRLHGDLHRGNVLWDEARGPLLVDFDDALLGPAVQDLWMLPGEDAARPSPEREALLEGYRRFAALPDAALAFAPLLRAARLAHWVGWIAERWADPAFPAAFPQLAEEAFWAEHVTDLGALARELESGESAAG